MHSACGNGAVDKFCGGFVSFRSGNLVAGFDSGVDLFHSGLDFCVCASVACVLLIVDDNAFFSGLNVRHLLSPLWQRLFAGVFSYLPANFIIYFAVLQGFLVGFCIFIIIKFYIFCFRPCFCRILYSMEPFKILVFDSGIGGLNVLFRLKTAFPYIDFYYLSDFKNAPYGAKTLEKLFSLAETAIKPFIENFSAVVLACNTLTTNCLNFLQARFKKPFFGVRPDLNGMSGKNLLICTAATKKATEENFFCGENLTVVAPKGWVESLEEEPFPENFSFFEKSLPKKSFDCVFAGCTHFIFLSEFLKNFYYPAKISDGIDPLIAELSLFLEKTVGRMTTESPVLQITAKNFLGDDKSRNFVTFSNLEGIKPHKCSKIFKKYF